MSMVGHDSWRSVDEKKGPRWLIFSTGRSIDWCNTRPDPNPIRLPGTKDFPYFPPSRGRWLSVFVAHYHCLLIKIGRSHWNHWSLIPEIPSLVVSNMLKSPVPAFELQRCPPVLPAVVPAMWCPVTQSWLIFMYLPAEWWRVYVET